MATTNTKESSHILRQQVSGQQNLIWLELRCTVNQHRHPNVEFGRGMFGKAVIFSKPVQARMTVMTKLNLFCC
jgi:hypothetical protein